MPTKTKQNKKPGSSLGDLYLRIPPDVSAHCVFGETKRAVANRQEMWHRRRGGRRGEVSLGEVSSLQQERLQSASNQRGEAPPSRPLRTDRGGQPRFSLRLPSEQWSSTRRHSLSRKQYPPIPRPRPTTTHTRLCSAKKKKKKKASSDVLMSQNTACNSHRGQYINVGL